MKRREVKLEEMLSSLIDRGYKGDRKKIVRALSISSAALSQYALGRTRPSFEKLVALAEFFDVTLDYLVYGESSAVPLDNGPVLKYLDSAMTGLKAESKRHTDVVTALGAVLIDRIDEAARDLAGSDTLGREGLVRSDEVMQIENHCRRADIIAPHLGFNVIEAEDMEAQPGQFMSVVSANVQKGCRYRFLLPGGSVDHRPAVADFRRLLTEMAGRDYAHECCLFRGAAQPIVAGAAMYDLDLARLENQNRLLFARLRKYISDDSWLGYVMEPNDDSNVSMLMGERHARLAREAFESIWTRGTAL